MDMFRPDGHLTEQALRALAAGEALPELARLEASEHLSYCDACLQRYTELLTEEALLPPPPQLERGLRRRITLRTARLSLSRCVAAAAAMAIVVTALWTVQLPALPRHSQQNHSLTAQEQTTDPSWLDRLSDGLRQFSAGFDIDIFGGTPATEQQGGDR